MTKKKTNLPMNINTNKKLNTCKPTQEYIKKIITLIKLASFLRYKEDITYIKSINVIQYADVLKDKKHILISIDAEKFLTSNIWVGWWCRLLITALESHRQVNFCEFEARLVYILSSKPVREYRSYKHN